MSSDPRVAIVGVAFRGPDAPDYSTFIDNLLAGRESIHELTDEDLASAGVPHSIRSDPRYVARRPLLADVWGFDQEFFGMGLREASIRNPQHRLFLELCATALQDANCDPEKFDGVIGVYGGCPYDDYLERNLLKDAKTMRLVGEMGARLANSRDYITSFVSYKLNLRGPSVSINTACSTGLVAVHMACQALRAGDCDAALVGAVQIEMPYARGYRPTPGGIESMDGHCRPLDHEASGTVFGSGGGILLLKLLEDAINDGDHVYGVILGSAVNNDGSGKSTFTSPNPRAQRDLIVEALAVSEIDPATLSYIELHATATRVGDPVEIDALGRALADSANSVLGPQSIAIGSAKANIGHLGSAAGIAGIIKLIGCLEENSLPPTINVSRPNPQLNLEESVFRLPRSREGWAPHAEQPRRAAVSSFGFGGTNAHVVIEEAPERRPSAVETTSRLRPVLLVWSAATAEQLREHAAKIASRIDNDLSVPLADISFSLATQRPHRAKRAFAVVTSRGEAVNALSGGLPATEASSGWLLEHERLAMIGRAWQGGDEVEWSGLHLPEDVTRARIPVSPWNRTPAYIAAQHIDDTL